MFIGPTSQAPRVDEARDDALYELEIAFQQLDAQRAGRTRRRRGSSTACLRNLLIGRHRQHAPRRVLASTSFIRPTAPTGRLGLLEFRAFEMPPHARMSLAQQLLLRALVARFWRDAVPRRRSIALGHGAARPIPAAALRRRRTSRDVVADLRRAGYPFDAEWFAPLRRVPLPALRHA